MSTALATDPTTSTPEKKLWSEIGLWVLGAIILVSYAGLWRPIWFDEFLHFAMGGMTFEYALKTIDYTTIEVNHGQTGVYMLLDWALLQLFGASAIALRLPSLLSAALLLAAAVTFLRLRGFSYGWQYVLLAAFATHGFLMGFAGEARPYMPLAAATVAVLTYYQYPVNERRRFWPMSLAIFGVIGGVLMHPYIAYLLLLILPFSIWIAVRDGRTAWSIRSISIYVNLPLLITGGGLFLLVGQLTWMRRVLSFGYDPLQWTGNSWGLLFKHGLEVHFINRSSGWLWLAVVTGLTLMCLALNRFNVNVSLLPPFALICIGLASSVTVSYLSVIRTYWIFPRQWVAGIAVVTLGSVWFFAELLRNAKAQDSKILRIPPLGFVLLIASSGLITLSSQIATVIDQRAAYAEFTSESRGKSELRPGQVNDDQGFIYAANVNIARGGSVWVMYIDWYNNLSGMRPEFRETNPRWTNFLD